MPPLTPREVADRFAELIAPGPAEELADLFAEDAVFEMPFLPPGAPAQEPGREAFRAHLKESPTVFDSVDGVRIYETDDPEVVIMERRLHGRVLATGKPFTFQVIMVARIRNGEIVWSRSYSNPLDAVIAFDGLHDLVAGLGAAS
jgi:ketosteroid isomerase-like protein